MAVITKEVLIEAIEMACLKPEASPKNKASLLENRTLCPTDVLDWCELNSSQGKVWLVEVRHARPEVLLVTQQQIDAAIRAA